MAPSSGDAWRPVRSPHAETLTISAETRLLVVAATAYRGEDLTQELARLIGDLRPTVIAVPRKEDQHPDHCAAWFFVADALGDVERVRRDYRVDVITYVVHYDNWPFQNSGSD